LTRIQLSLAISSNPRTWPILDGTVKPDGIDLIPTVMYPSEMFWRQLKFQDFDVSEMSLSSLMLTTAQGNDDWVGIPIFTTRKFFHTDIFVRKDAGIDTPADLKGKRAGVPEYQQTASLWIRAVLQHEFGVHPRELEHWMERLPSHSHGGATTGGATAVKGPPGVTIKQIPLEKNLGSMIVSGELDAVLHYYDHRREPKTLERSTVDLNNHPDIKTLFPDRIAEGVRYLRKTGMFPINHGMAVRRELAERHPWIALNLLKAFNKANEIADRQRAEHAQYHVWAGLIPQDAGKALRERVLRHGIQANRKTLEATAVYSHEQGLTPRVMKLEEFFASSTLDS
jgi:4,5-dihydroxyphthalate decarboxylase